MRSQYNEIPRLLRESGGDRLATHTHTHSSFLCVSGEELQAGTPFLNAQGKPSGEDLSRRLSGRHMGNKAQRGTVGCPRSSGVKDGDREDSDLLRTVFGFNTKSGG